MKKTMLALLCVALALLLAGCATVNGNNSFQSTAPDGLNAAQQTEAGQPTDAAQEPAPETSPTSDPNAAGYNG